MNIPPIPKYNDSENTVFHPVFAFALDVASKNKGLNDVEIVRQFKEPGGGLVDLVLRRKGSGKVILPIEIKRTISSVRGIGRRQARDYQMNLTSQAENKFYCVSNLELTELFQTDPLRTTTISQQIKLSSPQDVRLENGQDNYIIPTLIGVLEEIIEIVILKSKPAQYLVGQSDLEKELRGSLSSFSQWHESLVPFCFEYIRGNASLKNRTRLWRAASAYSSNPKRIIDLGGAIDFERIFSNPVPKASNFNSQVLNDAFVAGKAFGDGDDLAALVGEVLSDPQIGIVETDYDLARVLGVVVGHVAGALKPSDEILDPASGSGKLLAALVHEKYPNIKPENIVAVEKDIFFSEALSLRLGLQFANRVSKEHAPNIIIAPFESLDKAILSNVRIAVVNPPFISSINSVSEKNNIERKIRSITGNEPKLGLGQLGLEAIFMELVFRMVPDGTTIAFIYPNSIISRLSKEFAELRKFVIGEMGISHIITYPSEGVFEEVVKKTVIFVCTKGQFPSQVQAVDIQIRVPDLDLTAFATALADSSKECYGVQFGLLSQQSLLQNCDTGWKAFFGIGGEVNSFVSQNLGIAKSLLDYCPKMRRGTVGNSGNTALTVFTQCSLPDYVPEEWLISCVNNARDIPLLISAASAPNLSFLPPTQAYLNSGLAHDSLELIVDGYISRCNGKFSTKKQRTKSKDKSTIIADLKTDQRSPASHAILVPRACREEAKIAMVDDDPVLVSTNFMILPVADKENRMLLASWLQSIFGQLQIELYSTSEDGMRKTEKNVLSKVRVPDFAEIPRNIKTKIMECLDKEKFLLLNDVRPRESDCLWSMVLSPDDAKQVLLDGVRLLNAAYDDRVQ